jgi:hypothetical protein
MDYVNKNQLQKRSGKWGILFSGITTAQCESDVINIQ